MRAVSNRIIATVIPPETRTEGGIHLPDGMERHRLTKGDCMTAKVVAIGPQVYDVQVGMILYIDPNQAEDGLFVEDGTQYVSIPEEYFQWKEETGPLFGIFSWPEEA